VATVKLAAWVGLGVGLLLCIAGLFKKQVVAGVVFGGLVLGFLAVGGWLLIEYWPGFDEWLLYKLATRSGSFDDPDSFLASNWSSAIVAFQDSPFFGTGLGAFSGTYSSFEVHSTYLKVLGEAGLTGAIMYAAFMWSFWRTLIEGASKPSPYGAYLKLAKFFMIGCMLSWTYTYHLRKREFWIMAAIVLIASRLAAIPKSRSAGAGTR
jgi:O-antigen ligase